jgi:hypothetical protein
MLQGGTEQLGGSGTACPGWPRDSPRRGGSGGHAWRTDWRGQNRSGRLPPVVSSTSRSSGVVGPGPGLSSLVRDVPDSRVAQTRLNGSGAHCWLVAKGCQAKHCSLGRLFLKSPQKLTIGISQIIHVEVGAGGNEIRLVRGLSHRSETDMAPLGKRLASARIARRHRHPHLWRQRRNSPSTE